MNKDIKIRKKGNSYEQEKQQIYKIYGFEVTKRISKTALTEEKAKKLLKLKEQEELIYAAEQVKIIIYIISQSMKNQTK